MSSTPLTLRDYQETSIAQVLRLWRDGERSLLGQAATGLGKTVIGVGLVRKLFAIDPDARILWLAHRKELIDQPERAFRRWAPELTVGVVKAGRREYMRQVVIGSVPSLNARALPDLPPITAIIVDECHHALETNSYGAIIDRCREMVPTLNVLGLTATPWRTDKKGLGGLFGRAAFGWDIAWGCDNHHLTRPVGLRIDTATSLADVKVRSGDFVQKDLARAANTDQRNTVVVEAWQRHCSDRRSTLAFTVDIQHAKDLAIAFRTAGISAEAVWGVMDSDLGKKGAREDTLARFESGEIRVLTNCNVLSEGYDAPFVTALLMGRPTKSLLLYVQQIGRGTRLFAGKKDCLVVDVADVSSDVGGLRSILDLGIPEIKDAETGEVITRPEPEGEAPRDELPRDRHGRVVWTAQAFDLFTGRISWEWVGSTRVLAMGGQRYVAIWPGENGGFKVAMGDAREGKIDWLLWGDNPEADAIAAAENCVRRCGAEGRYVTTSRWWERSDNKATDDQRRRLGSFGFAEGETTHWSRGKARRVLSWATFGACYDAWLNHGQWPDKGVREGYARRFYDEGGTTMAGSGTV